MAVRFWSILVFVFAVAGCSSGPGSVDDAVAKPADDNLIVPGRRIGLVYVGMPLPEALRILGTPIRTNFSHPDGDPTFGAYSFASGITLVVRGSAQRVISLTSDSRTFKTREGLSVGSSEADIRLALGIPTRRRVPTPRVVVLHYPGIEISLDEGRVDLIVLY